MLRLELIAISKEYPAVKANDRVGLRVAPGEIHAVLGENGAGKSTLMKIIYGAVRPDAGEMLWDGRAVEIRHPQEARALGIAMVFQHFSLFDTLTAAENVWLGLDRSWSLADVTKRITEVAHEYGLDVDPLRPVHTLSVGERQRVEIVRALLTKPRLLILDEPTSVLTPQAVQALFATLRQLAAEGCSILYISHKLDEIRALCHKCTVMRGGRVTGEVDPRGQSNASLSRLMIGAEPPPLEHRQAAPGEQALAVRGLTLARTASTCSPGVAWRCSSCGGSAPIIRRDRLALLSWRGSTSPVTLPARITVHLWHSARISSSLWLMYRMLQPSSARRRSVSKSFSTACGVSTDVGSSMIRSRGFCSRQRTISTRWRSPTDIECTIRSGSSGNPYRFETSRMRLARPARAPPASSASAMFSATVKVSNSEKCWNTMPMPSFRARAGFVIRTGLPSQPIVPASGFTTP